MHSTYYSDITTCARSNHAMIIVTSPHASIGTLWTDNDNKAIAISPLCNVGVTIVITL